MLSELSKGLHLFCARTWLFPFPLPALFSAYLSFILSLSFSGPPWCLALLSFQPWSNPAVSSSVSYTPAVTLNEINFRKSTDWIHDKCLIYRSSWALLSTGQSFHSFSVYSFSTSAPLSPLAFTDFIRGHRL